MVAISMVAFAWKMSPMGRRVVMVDVEVTGVFVVDESLRTLMDFRYNRHFKADSVKRNDQRNNQAGQLINQNRQEISWP